MTLAETIQADLAHAAETLQTYLAWRHETRTCHGDERCPLCAAERDESDRIAALEDEEREIDPAHGPMGHYGDR
jgi:hypothetical protein